MKPSSGASATDDHDSLEVLVLATKTPWPPHDGGRRVLFDELSALTSQGVRPTLIAPCPAEQLPVVRRALDEISVRTELVPLAPEMDPERPRWRTCLDPTILRLPFSAVRFRHRRFWRHVERLLQERSYDLIHCEQLQALSLVHPDRLRQRRDRQRQPPVVLRSQNVEADLWLSLAEALGPSSKPLVARALRWEARRMRRYEVRCCRTVAACLTITEEDRQRLISSGADPRKISCVPAPFPEQLPSRPQPLEGDPSLVMVVGNGWLPNQLAAADFLERVWPHLGRAFPNVQLHCFGAFADSNPSRTLPDPRIVHHPSPERAVELFDAESILLVPLEVASGVRIKILDAWARRVPVICSSTAARGLCGSPGNSHLEANSPEQWVEAIEHLRCEDQRRRLTSGGRDILLRSHDPSTIANQMIRCYESVIQPGSSPVLASRLRGP